MDTLFNQQPIMKTLELTDEKIAWLIIAVENRAAGNFPNAILKGELLVSLAKLMEPLKEVQNDSDN